MKKIELKDAVFYDAPGHFNVSTMRLHGKEESGATKFTMGLSHFLPGGGCEMGASPTEKIYLVLNGEITVTTQTEEYVLGPMDSIFIGPDEERAVINNTKNPVSMLVIMNTLE
jgi:quercetin dioxygenase-like cupin family protein